ncbi:radical SAM protein [Campylobacter sp. RM9328]|uniref:radical SAM protein n=1 Tax=Campylobacter sp. RM9328 TaxID=1705720 RepID=UPI001475A17B
MYRDNRGCSHDQCTFCNFYKGYPFRAAPLSQIEEDLKEASKIRPNAKIIWASGGNPYTLNTNKLLQIAELFKKYLPKATTTTYAHIKDIKKKSLEEIKQLKEAGFVELVIGVESADDEVLKAVNKGYTAADVLEQCTKLEAAGVEYGLIYLSGLSEAGKNLQSVRTSLKTINKLSPIRIYYTTVAVVPDTKMYEDVRSGKFKEAGELERIEEMREFVAGTKIETEIYALTSTNAVPLVANMPEDRDAVLAYLDEVIANFTEFDEIKLAKSRAKMTRV